MSGHAAQRSTVHPAYNLGVACSDAPAQRVAGRPAIMHEHDGVTDILTFGELATASSAAAAKLRALGIGHGDRVGVFASAGNDTAVAHLGALKVGAITVPLVSLLGDEAIAYRLDDAGVSCVFVAEADRTRLEAILLGTPAVHHVIELDGLARASATDGDGFVPAATSPDDPATIIYSSGTTGKAKGALEPHGIVLGRHAPMAMIHGPFVPDDVFWTPVDWMWIGSFIDALLTPLSYGCTVLAYDRRKFDASDAVDRLKAFGVTKAFIPPTALRMLMDVPAAEWEGHRLTSVHSGGESLTADAAGWARETLQLTIDEIYGMTEASFTIGSAHRFYPPAEGSMGRPYPGQPVRLRSEDGGEAPPGTPGEILIGPSSPSLFLGYWGLPDATAAQYVEGWYSTGDLAVRDERGYLFYVGRKDDLIMSAGHRLGPTEIEDALVRHAAVRSAVVVGAPDSERGQVVKAVIQLTPAAGGTDRDELTRQLQEAVRVAVGRHAYPRSIEYIDEFPRTITGKVRRDVLRLSPAERAKPT